MTFLVQSKSKKNMMLEGIVMKRCSKCQGELIEDLNVTAQGVYEVAVSHKKRLLNPHRAKVKAALCPVCGDVTFYVDKEAVEMIQEDIQK